MGGVRVVVLCLLCLCLMGGMVYAPWPMPYGWHGLCAMAYALWVAWSMRHGLCLMGGMFYAPWPMPYGWHGPCAPLCLCLMGAMVRMRHGLCLMGAIVLIGLFSIKCLFK